MEEEFKNFLRSKKISPKLLKEAEKDLFEEWLILFSAVNPKSFVMQKLYLINDIRRKYHLDKENSTTLNEA
ncbi:hypothetical protein Fleli_3346 [Bernardetia litoralis DSM 6794]|uniref:Uncharacterized protein n=2 Tax=Bernardetia litoralis TaxID=999 RepID=I4ANZ0_BERLS|nr:hypothetical protein Fleli_3346 [Bernardetia litoralis DSM 6794]